MTKRTDKSSTADCKAKMEMTSHPTDEQLSRDALSKYYCVLLSVTPVTQMRWSI